MATTADNTNSQFYLGFIFPSGAEGIEGEAVVHSDLEELKKVVAAAVDLANADVLDDPVAFSWQDGATSYWPDTDLPYGFFVWARIKPVTLGELVAVSEFA